MVGRKARRIGVSWGWYCSEERQRAFDSGIDRKGETSLLESPVRESNSNAHVERAIRSWRDQFRTLRHYTERRFGKKIPRDCALMGWLVSWSSEVLNRVRVRSNGRTAFEMATLHKVRHKVMAFGEKVYFQHTHVWKEDDRNDGRIRWYDGQEPDLSYCECLWCVWQFERCSFPG